MYWIQGKHRGSWVWVFLRLSVSLKLIFIVPFNFHSISIFFLFAGEGATGREQPQGRKFTLAGPKSDIGRAEKSHKGQNVTLECYNIKQQWHGHMSYTSNQDWSISMWHGHVSYTSNQDWSISVWHGHVSYTSNQDWSTSVWHGHVSYTSNEDWSKCDSMFWDIGNGKTWIILKSHIDGLVVHYVISNTTVYYASYGCL